MITKLNYESLPRHILSQENLMISKSCVKGLLNYFSKIYEFQDGTPLVSFNDQDTRLMSSLLVKYMKKDQWLNALSNPTKYEIMKIALIFISGKRKSKAEVTKFLKFFTQREDDNTLFNLMRPRNNNQRTKHQTVLALISEAAEAIVIGLKEKQKQIYRLIFILLSNITDEIKMNDTEGKSYHPADVFKRLLKRLFVLPTVDFNINLRQAIANIDNISSSDEGFHQILEIFVEIWTSDIAAAATEDAPVVDRVEHVTSSGGVSVSSTNNVVVASIATTASENPVADIATAPVVEINMIIPLRGRDEKKTKKKKRKIY